MLDQDFNIERPTRYYRQGLNLLAGDGNQVENAAIGMENKLHLSGDAHASRHTISGTLRHGMRKAQKALHLGHGKRFASQPAAIGGHGGDGPDGDNGESSSSSSDSDSEDHEHERADSPMLDPSTNTNPLAGEDHDEVEVGKAGAHPNATDDKKKKKRKTNEVSRHTFYIENSQMRLKLYARNEVRDRSGTRRLRLTCRLYPSVAPNAAMDRSVGEGLCNLALHWRKPIRQLCAYPAQRCRTVAGRWPRLLLEPGPRAVTCEGDHLHT